MLAALVGFRRATGFEIDAGRVARALLAVAKALINLSSGNAAAKESIVNEGGVRSLLPHLLTKTEELTRAFCVLLKNCLTSPDLRERIVNDGAVHGGPASHSHRMPTPRRREVLSLGMQIVRGCHVAGAATRAASAQDGDPRGAALGGSGGGRGVGGVEHLGA